MMSVPRRLRAVLWLLALTLPAEWGCNSGEQPGVLVPDPRPFQEMARSSPCADQKNRLFLIDLALVFSDQAGSCADGAYSQTLYGATPEVLLCRYNDSIAGPQRECRDPRFQQLFDIILAHLEEPDLGLGPRHLVRPIPF